MRSSLFLLCLMCIPSSVFAQQWADLKWTVCLDGEAPAPEKIDGGRDELCTDFKIVSEDLIVHKENKGIKNVFVVLDAKASKLDKNEIYPDLAPVPKTKLVLDNISCTFVPHALLVRAGQMIDVKNSDKASHNANFQLDKDPKNMMIPSGSSLEYQIVDAENDKVEVVCNIHSWMKAHLMILDHPYMALSDAMGVVKMDKLPAGKELTFRIIHESIDGSLDEIELAGKKEKLTRGGRFKLTLKPGMNDLGTVKIARSKFTVN